MDEANWIASASAFFLTMDQRGYDGIEEVVEMFAGIFGQEPQDKVSMLL